MPNTPALVGEGMTGYCYDDALFNEEEKTFLADLFNSFGKAVKVSEKIMSAVVCASGSSPAYVFMFIEALADSVVKYGMYICCSDSTRFCKDGSRIRGASGSVKGQSMFSGWNHNQSRWKVRRVRFKKCII